MGTLLSIDKKLLAYPSITTLSWPATATVNAISANAEEKKKKTVIKVPSRGHDF